MKKIAIACQGGGSQTAFTAGVLAALFDEGVHHKRRVVGLSGTSGGAICATLSWYGILRETHGDASSIGQRIEDFWADIVAQTPAEIQLDTYLAEMLRLIDKGLLPHVEVSPVSTISQMFFSMISAYAPRPFFTDLRASLEKHIHFHELATLAKEDSPALLLGAADVLTGELKKFNSLKGEICVEAVLASAAIPTLFPAVQVGASYYWDGLFSDNPPIKELVRLITVGAERIPDEVWVIQINPTNISKVPTTTSEIIDRRNQMTGNVSLFQSLEWVEFYNMLLREKLVSFESLERSGFPRREPIEIRFIQMDPEVQANLDYVSKLSREPGHVRRLIDHGREQARKFLKALE
ncbi:MAG: patatin-like phospholipase family protein [Pirellulales bacterium]